jgi:hypothetical protein
MEEMRGPVLDKELGMVIDCQKISYTIKIKSCKQQKLELLRIHPNY